MEPALPNIGLEQAETGLLWDHKKAVKSRAEAASQRAPDMYPAYKGAFVNGKTQKTAYVRRCA
jgi:hypothetical protein